jgi:hypothetical protein
VADLASHFQGPDCLEFAGAIGSADAEPAEPTIVDAQQSGGGLSATNAEPAPTEDTACVELIGAAERAATAESEAFGGLGRRRGWARATCTPQNDVARGNRAVKALPAPRGGESPTWCHKEGEEANMTSALVVRDGVMEFLPFPFTSDALILPSPVSCALPCL